MTLRYCRISRVHARFSGSHLVGAQWRVQQIRGNHSWVAHGPGPAAQQEISFQQFRNQLLAKGLVDKLEVTNKSLVKVYVRTSAASPDAEGSLRSGNGAPPATRLITR